MKGGGDIDANNVIITVAIWTAAQEGIEASRCMLLLVYFLYGRISLSLSLSLSLCVCVCVCVCVRARVSGVCASVFALGRLFVGLVY